MNEAETIIIKTARDLDEAKGYMATGAITVNESSAMGIHHGVGIGFSTLSANIFVVSPDDQEQKPTGSFTSRTTYDRISSEVGCTYNPVVKSPVYVENGSIQVSSKRLEIGRQYPVIFNNKKYVVISPKEGVVDLYEFSSE